MVALWEREALVGSEQLIPDFQCMTSSSMRCANKTTTEAAARMCSAGEQVNQYSAAGVSSPTAVDKHPATPNVAGARVYSREASSSAA